MLCRRRVNRIGIAPETQHPDAAGKDRRKPGNQESLRTIFFQLSADSLRGSDGKALSWGQQLAPMGDAAATVNEALDLGRGAS